jgi:hypothetical protein
MLNKPTDWASLNPTSAFAKGQEQTEAMLGMQKEPLDAYEQASLAGPRAVGGRPLDRWPPSSRPRVPCPKRWGRIRNV